MFLLAAIALVAGGGWSTADPAKIAKGKEVYETGCVLCHGQTGAGNPEWESEVRPVSFADCGTTAEPSALWKSIVRNGGPKHGLSDVMPAFGEAFPEDELDAVVAYLRTFCATADRYPPGDLNFRRAHATGKAFPEAEVVIKTKIVPFERETELEFVYENRLGPRFQYELEFPLRPTPTKEGHGAGVGDVVVSGKYVIAFNPARLLIVSGGLEAAFPTGSEGKGLGSGTTVFSPFVTFGKAYSFGTFQSRLSANLPADTNRAGRNYGYALAYSFPAIGFSRTGYVPTVELLGAYNPNTEAHEQTMVFGVSKALSRLGHVIGSIGIGVPLRPRGAPHPKEFHAYLLWDFGDGPFWKGF
jgi:mono/diheme cytochrome c family protein